MSRPDHEPFREALAQRLDQPLEPGAEARLEAHLATCGPCRSVAQAYDAQRKALRELHIPEPPRDLWARTATALDHEVAHRGHAPRLVALGSLASLGLVLALALGASGLGPFNATRPGNATPFPVTPEPVAYLTTDGNQITIYQTQVSAFCPPSAPDCTDPGPSARPVARVALDAALSPRDLALAADGNLAITARDSLGRAIYSVVALPGSEATATASPSITARSTASRRPGPPTPTASLPAASASDTSGPTVLSSAPDLTDATLQPLLSDVIAAGAPAAWSPDGTILAFSARPADGSTGPDVYVWHVGASAVTALTKDHHSYFASWDGQRIVVSRTPATPAPARTASPHRTASRASVPASPTAAASATAVPSSGAITLLLDPATGATQRVALPDAWLPAVDPTGRLVVFWSGTLTAHGPTVDLTAGALFLADWSAITGIPPVATPSPTQPDAVAASLAGASATPLPSVSTAPPASAGQEGPTPPLTGPTAAADSAQPTGAAGATTGSTPPAASGTATSPAVAVPVTQTGTDVTDWLVRWAPDGGAYGVWTADAPGSDAGTLTVVAATGTLAGQDLLGSTPAQRAFSLGDGRVAWVTPDSTGETGDLRVVTWGADGPGGVHIPVRHGVTLAF
ncbi:MAG TPA: zf-HC2 domain-containing protein [Candidatus Sulfotelmatobacter sp.]|nr:zf-HC2 domain-containing protein [Candidatus Sulfotelmatobacter sp.]